jgi:hypothetical protein
MGACAHWMARVKKRPEDAHGGELFLPPPTLPARNPQTHPNVSSGLVTLSMKMGSRITRPTKPSSLRGMGPCTVTSRFLMASRTDGRRMGSAGGGRGGGGGANEAGSDRGRASGMGVLAAAPALPPGLGRSRLIWGCARVGRRN